MAGLVEGDLVAEDLADLVAEALAVAVPEGAGKIFLEVKR